MTLMMTTTAISVHRKGDSPVFGESVTVVALDDEAAGPYITLEQYPDTVKEAKIKLEIDELEMILKAAKQLMDQEGLKE